jgi:hypothetical protein
MNKNGEPNYLTDERSKLQKKPLFPLSKQDGRLFNSDIAY